MTCTTFRFKVTGNNPFPIDMLRRDRCFPASERDAGLMTSTMTYDNVGPLTVELLVHVFDRPKFWQPTIERWKSFGWEVHPTWETVV